ncbi:UNVERIFIED_CONTAM: hypothetical protein HHA_264468 [Hammondia hammondi]|eukprot:XP_008887267.1 hypothetical protein HHA_264468 [Hammondia hammondi]
MKKKLQEDRGEKEQKKKETRRKRQEERDKEKEICRTTVHWAKDHSLFFSPILLRQTRFRFYLLDSRAFHSDSKEQTERPPTDVFLIFLSSSATTSSSTFCKSHSRD